MAANILISRRGLRVRCVRHSVKNFHNGTRNFSTTLGNELLRDDGIVEGVWVFARHGDRTPSRSLCAAHRKDEEAAFWRSKLPTPDPVTALKVLSENFPLDIHPSNQGRFLDVKRRPFGFLTKVGIDQLHTNGKRFCLRYESHGHHCPTTGKPVPFLDSWDVKAYSTNYLRTILSVQCFLDGLLGVNCYIPHGYQHAAPLEDDSERLVPDHSSVGDIGTENALVAVAVRDRATDNLNAFDRNPELIKQLVTEVVTSDYFVTHDYKAAPLAARLAYYLPDLARPGKQTFGGPSGINWVEASDHFICRSAHGVKYSLFSEFEHDSSAEGILRALEHPTILHLAWRFRQWYKHPPLLAEIASPALREVLVKMQAIPAMGIQDRRPFTIYSCHDVTILALLYGLGADFLADENKGDWRFWPKYGSTLVFELIRVDGANGKPSHLVRVLLNGKPVRSVDLLDFKGTGPPDYIGHGPMKMLTICDFEKVISKLEKVGGMPHEYIPVTSDSITSDRIVKGEAG